ncbi:RHOMBOID-like protein 3 isoform X1 [Zea mays]|uniref:RHOMBOID-like protein 3 isoform X1 n=1 Tax=Zea mays TaxID=4577 RepID=UPI0009A97A57|nr:RHOMBOID-like protein 3 isoform X1 [Zea mays]|eukprot:XP_020408386.1 RHOMBOID-like protein 3 isoform X1 [Zea mays]
MPLRYNRMPSVSLPLLWTPRTPSLSSHAASSSSVQAAVVGDEPGNGDGGCATDASGWIQWSSNPVISGDDDVYHSLHFSVRTGVIYLISGFGGSVLSALFLHSNYISVGASGALFGLLGSMLSELIMNWTIYSNKAAAIITLLFIIVINLAIGILPHADNFAHLGGFASGFLIGSVLLARPQFGWMERSELPQTNQPPKYKSYQYVLWVAALLLLVVGFAIILVMLFKGKNGNDSCHWCHYLNCVPTSRWKCDT